METIPEVWSKNMLKKFRDICIYGLGLDCALTGCQISRRYSLEENDKSVKFYGFIPRDFIENVPVTIYELDSTNDNSDDIGVIEIKNIPSLDLTDVPPTAQIYCGIKNINNCIGALKKTVHESRLFNLHTNLEFHLDISQIRDIEPNELLNTKIPIKNLSVDSEKIICGIDWLEQRRNRSKNIKNSHRKSFMTKVSYAWNILFNIILIGITIKIFSLMDSQIDVIMSSLLILLLVLHIFSFFIINLSDKSSIAFSTAPSS